jgi:murein hydrolase activator
MTAGKIFRVVLILFFACFLVDAQAQKTKAQLQKEKQDNLKKIQQAEKILAETASRKQNTLGELNALNEQIRVQEALINSFKSEIRLINSEITNTGAIIEALQGDLESLRQEYAAMVYAAQKASKSTTRLTFVFSSANFRQFFMRMKYMEQYGDMRKTQVEQINKVMDALGGQVKSLESKKQEKETLLQAQLAENDKLLVLKQRQDQVMKSLGSQETQLRKELEETKRAVARLDKMIDDIIREEIARAEREAKAREARSVASGKPAAPDVVDMKLSVSFQDNRTKFPWPVSGFVSQKFGPQKHPVLKGIDIDNDGINIQTKEKEKVKAVFEGEVREVFYLPGTGNSVMIKHGEYFTVYSGLREVYVKKGQKVNTLQEIGEIVTNAEGVSELRFQIRKKLAPLDPQQWLMKR